MARRLLNYRGVPDDEREALRERLDAQHIDYYEVPPTAFGISAGSLWIRHDEDWPAARALFDAFQDEWAEAARRGPAAEPFLVQFRRRPWQLVGYLLAALFVLLLMFWPVAQLWG